MNGVKGMQEQASAGFWLSPQQRFAWKIQQESLRASSRTVCLVLLEGPVEIERLRDALRSMVSRHDILRTVFRRQTGMKVPFQVVLDSAEFGWRQLDLSALAAPERESQVHKLFERERTTEISFEDGPALRAVLISLTVDTFALVISVSPLCADAQSLQILVRELGFIYSHAPLSESFRYVQFAQWQADLLESDEEDAR
ncbi:MAG TPA: condensation domain-containing protein, partial [Terriglobales bacterium]